MASFFASRVDTEVDKRLGEDHPLLSKAAVANARVAFSRYERVFTNSRWKGARGRRRPSPAAAVGLDRREGSGPADTVYVTDLVAGGTVNTTPEKALLALDDHGEFTDDTVTGSYAEAQQVLDDLADAGVDYDDVVRLLEKEGLTTFEDAWAELLQNVGSNSTSKRNDDLLRRPPEK